MADDPDVSAVALAVDLVEEYDGDTSYPDAVLDVRRRRAARRARQSAVGDRPATPPRGCARAGIPVLEGTRSGLVALRHLLAARDAHGRSMHRS